MNKNLTKLKKLKNGQNCGFFQRFFLKKLNGSDPIGSNPANPELKVNNINISTVNIFSIFSSYFVYLQELASHSPLGLNLTDDIAFECPASVNFKM